MGDPRSSGGSRGSCRGPRGTAERGGGHPAAPQQDGDRPDDPVSRPVPGLRVPPGWEYDRWLRSHSGMTPQRIQRKRTKGWRMPEGAIYVGRPTVYSNPFPIEGEWITGAAQSFGYPTGPAFLRGTAVALYRWWLTGEEPIEGLLEPPFGYRVELTEGTSGGAAWFEGFGVIDLPRRPDLTPLRGHDLACWCPVGGWSGDIYSHRSALAAVPRRRATGARERRGEARMTTLPIVDELPPEAEPPPVRCQCHVSGCVCNRVDPELDYRWSSWLVCQPCCLDRHVWARHKHVYRCDCGKVPA